MNTVETITEGHMHEHVPLFTSVPFAMFDEDGWVGGCVGGWCVVLCCVVLRCAVLW